MSQLQIVVLQTPPSGNHYKKPRRGLGWYITKEAENFFAEVAAIIAGRKVEGKSYRVKLDIYLGKGQKGDLDNFSKCALDSLTRAGVWDSDDKVHHLEMRKFTHDRGNPRTEMTIEALK